MPEVVILLESLDTLSQTGTLPPGQNGSKEICSLERSLQLSALKQAIAEDDPRFSLDSIQVMTLADLAVRSVAQTDWLASVDWVCPLTLNLPADLPFWGQAIWSACREVESLQQRVAAWQTLTNGATANPERDAVAQPSDYWLPIVFTAKGPLYAEVIGEDNSAYTNVQAGMRSRHPYLQPIHLRDAQRQPLYELGYWLLKTLSAPPSVYLMQFSGDQAAIAAGNTQDFCFQRLIPFPDFPAIASLGIQTPNLFSCYWRCLTGQPIRDLTII